MCHTYITIYLITLASSALAGFREGRELEIYMKQIRHTLITNTSLNTTTKTNH